MKITPFPFRPASHTNHPHARDINTALIKLYSESNSSDRLDKISHLLAEVTIDQMSESDANLDYIGESIVEYSFLWCHVLVYT